MGTPDYLAPEQAANPAAADIRADIYSLGCTLFQLLTCDVPFPGGNASEKITRHNTIEPLPIMKLRRDVPVALANVVNKMMAKSPAQRNQTPAEVAEALRPYAEPALRRPRWFWLLPLMLLFALIVGGVGLAWNYWPVKKTPALPQPANRNVGRPIDGWGEWIDPVGDCTIQADKAKVVITAASGVHALNTGYGNMDAPRLLRPVKGNFKATVKLTADFSARDPHEFLSAGMLLMVDNWNYLRFERNIWQGGDGLAYSIGPLFEYVQDGKELTKTNGKTVPFFQGNSTYLQLTRRDDRIEWGLSHDGQNWIRSTRPLNVTLARQAQLGFAVVTTSQKPFTVEFSEFTLVTE
jgi:regulation of enolase protein 1 (concanavalin A-like superfamily)